MPHRRTALLTGAAVLAIALVAGAVAAVLWWSRSPDGPPRAEHMLPGTYPTPPQYAWRMQAQSLVSGAHPGIATPLFGAARYAGPGAVVIGNHVLIHAAPDPPEPEGAQLVSLSLSDGRVEWSVPVNLSDGCARDLLGDLLPCIESTTTGGENEVEFVDINTGATVSSARIPFNLSMVATDGEYLYTAGYDDAAGFTVAKGSRENPVAEWTTVVPQGQCAGYGGGDAMDLQVEDGLVWGFLGGGADAALRESDGSPIFDHEVADVSVRDGPTVTARHCQDGVDFTKWVSEFVDGQGQPLFTSAVPLHEHALEVYSGGRPPFVTVNGDGLDPVTGERLWRIAQPADQPELTYPTWLVGNVMVVPDDGLTAYDLRTGQKLWHTATINDGREALTDGQHLLLAGDGGRIDAYTIADGTRVWSIPPGRDSSWSPIYATDRGLLVVSRDSVGLLRPTGPRASIPGAAGINARTGQNSGGTR